MAWLLYITGILFCLAGMYQFRKNVFEENKSVRSSIFIMIMGVILIAIGTAKYFEIVR